MPIFKQKGRFFEHCFLESILLFQRIIIIIYKAKKRKGDIKTWKRLLSIQNAKKEK